MAPIDEYAFDNRTVLIAGAGCMAGAELGGFYARAGARVVLVDRREAAILDIARRHPARIDALQLDVMRPALCQRLGKVWADEPLDVLIHLQMLQYTASLGAAMASVEVLTRALRAGLAARGRVVILAAPGPGGAAARAMRRATDGFAGALQDVVGGPGVTVNALRLPRGGAEAVDRADLIRVMAFLTAPGAARVGGAVLPLLPRAD